MNREKLEKGSVNTVKKFTIKRKVELEKLIRENSPSMNVQLEHEHSREK